MAQYVKLEAYTSDDFTLSVQYQSGDSTALSIEGFTFYFTGKTSLDGASGDYVFNKEVTSHTNAAGGLTSITIPRAETALLNGIYYYDLKYKDTGDKIHTACSGVIEFIDSVRGPIS